MITISELFSLYGNGEDDVQVRVVHEGQAYELSVTIRWFFT